MNLAELKVDPPYYAHRIERSLDDDSADYVALHRTFLAETAKTMRALITAVEAARPAMEAMEEAITYTSSPVWSPSLTKECESALSGLRVALEAVEKS
jgi:hypothetical protein